MKHQQCTLVTRVSHEAKGDARYRGASPFYFTCTKRYLAVYSPRRPPTPANGCHATGTRAVWGRRSMWSTSYWKSSIES
jgi:hypothetical protein